MNKVRIIILLLAGLSFSFVAEAQNPRRTKVYKKKLKKTQKPQKEPIPYSVTHRDTDGDGASDYYDHCPGTPPGQTVTSFGCPPDRDQDGVYDFEDGCPDVAGPRLNKGCPYQDTDGDGIPDKEDSCPTVKGERRFLGCPDTDGDGVPDSKDKCPNERAFTSDGCPHNAGGNKDTDGDGVPDFKDACYTTPGVPENNGCPEMSEEDKQAIKEAFKNLLFESGKDIIKPSSFKSLDKLAKALSHNPGAKLNLEGHTDNVGDDNKNMDLSKRRAKAVKNYLIGQGISSSEITSKGFGETKPVDDNSTKAGRTNNRRVEMLIEY